MDFVDLFVMFIFQCRENEPIRNRGYLPRYLSMTAGEFDFSEPMIIVNNPPFPHSHSKEPATLDGYNSISIHGNHSYMVKFILAEEDGFKGVLVNLSGYNPGSFNS